MNISTKFKLALNWLLRPFNLRIETLTATKLEAWRIEAFYKKGMFDGAIFTVPESISNANYSPLLEALPEYSARFSSFHKTTDNDVGYRFDNSYFSSPDTEILYAVVRQYKPKRFVEIGCGNSTRIVRQAIKDGNLDTRLISIDPSPRIDIAGFSDQIIRRPVEDVDLVETIGLLEENDILFIDSSHIVKTGSDVVFLFLNVLPTLPTGAVVHIHDIFLPYEYPAEWVMQHGYGFNEQYLLQALLSCGEGYSVIWPGYYLQKSFPDFAQHFPHLGGGRAQSFWMVKK
jgi:hypothetical protein